MTENTLVFASTTTQVYKNPIAISFFNNLDAAYEEVCKTGKLSFPVIEKIIGKPPVIPDSPDMDARLEAYEELTRYSTQVLNVESKLKTYAEKKRA